MTFGSFASVTLASLAISLMSGNVALASSNAPSFDLGSFLGTEPGGKESRRESRAPERTVAGYSCSKNAACYLTWADCRRACGTGNCLPVYK